MSFKVLSKFGILITVIGIAMSLLHIAGDGMVTGVGLILYALVTFKEYQTTHSSGSGGFAEKLLTFCGLIVLLISAFFKIMSWPYANILLIVGFLMHTSVGLIPKER